MAQACLVEVDERFTAPCAQGAKNAEPGFFLNRRDPAQGQRGKVGGGSKNGSPCGQLKTIAAKRRGAFPLPASLPCHSFSDGGSPATERSKTSAAFAALR
jgi:hypothetical protein